MPPNDPPGPKAAWFGLGLARRFRNEPLTFLPELARRFGDLVGFRMGPFRTYFAFHPDLVHEVLAARAKSFRRWAWQTKPGYPACHSRLLQGWYRRSPLPKVPLLS